MERSSTMSATNTSRVRLIFKCKKCKQRADKRGERRVKRESGGDSVRLILPKAQAVIAESRQGREQNRE
jgi:hypothetical protein